MLAYGIPILAILIVLPASQVSGLTGFLDAVKATFTVYGGHVAPDGTVTLTGAGLLLGRVAAVVFIFALASAGTTWIMGADRAEAVASFDGGGPRVLGRFSARFGTPIAMNLLSGVVATVLMIAAFQITGGDASRYFSAVLGLTISTTTISYLFIFPALIKLRYSRPDVERPYRVPGGTAGAWICSVVPTFWALLATVALIWPGLRRQLVRRRGQPERRPGRARLLPPAAAVRAQPARAAGRHHRARAGLLPAGRQDARRARGRRRPAVTPAAPVNHPEPAP